MTIETAVDPIFTLALACGCSACFAARESGLYRCDDGGRTWQPLYASLQLAAPLATTAVLAVDVGPHPWRCGATPSLIGMGEGAGSEGQLLLAGVPGGILRSVDGGARWQVTTLPGAPTVSALAASPDFARDATLFAATLGDGVLLSVDGGATWAHWSFGLLDMQVLCLAVSPKFAQDQTLFAGTETGLFRSTNGGRSWREVALPRDAPVTSIAAAPADLVLVGTEDQGVWLSYNGGASWSACAAPIADEPVVSVSLYALAPGQIAIDLVTSAAALRSPDGGETWATIIQLDQAEDQITAAALAGGKIVLGYADGRTTML